jgi:hypothetical protein
MSDPNQRITEAVNVIRKYHLDENGGDWTERAETVLFILTDGAEGRDWGHGRDG